MAKNLLEQLREMTVVVADTGDIQAIETFKPRDATTNPSLITAAAQMPQYQGIVDDTLKGARSTLGAAASAAEVVTLAFDRLAVSFGLKILEIIEGRVSTEVDARPLPRSTTITKNSVTKPKSWVPASETSVKSLNWLVATC